MPTDQTRPRWASRVRPDGIARLYAKDAQGIYDEDLIEEVGGRLYDRCHSIILVNQAMAGLVSCPACAHDIPHDGHDTTALRCARCSWHMTWGEYRQTFRGKKLYGGAIDALCRQFIDQFDAARSPRDKMIAIDRLIHTFHHQLTQHPTAPAGKNLIFGNVQEVVQFLNQLTYGPNSTPELRQTKAAYDNTLSRSWAGGVPPQSWSDAWAKAHRKPAPRSGHVQ
jgi:hypothetical protein